MPDMSYTKTCIFVSGLLQQGDFENQGFEAISCHDSCHAAAGGCSHLLSYVAGAIRLVLTI